MSSQVYHCVDESGAVRAAFKLEASDDLRRVFVRVGDAIFFSGVRANVSSDPVVVASALNDWLHLNVWCRVDASGEWLSGAWNAGNSISVVLQEGGAL